MQKLNTNPERIEMRALATIRIISDINPIPNADAIELAQLDGWQSVIKKGEYNIGDKVVYLEVDSWVPHTLAPFLSKGKEPKVFNGVPGERLRTMRLRGVLSQGLILPLNTVFALPSNTNADIVHSDVTAALGVQKWEIPIPAQLAGQVRGNFPSDIPKTDQERVQNINLEEYLDELYEVTEKLHGSSCTYYLDLDGEFRVCSRNLDLKPDDNNAYWKMARKLNIEARMREHNLYGYAIQGELIGEGINGNNYKVQLEFFVFDIYKVDIGYLLPEDRQDIVSALNIQHVPVIGYGWEINHSKNELLEMADGTSLVYTCGREGLVYKSMTSDKSFKVVSNTWLLKNE